MDIALLITLAVIFAFTIADPLAGSDFGKTRPGSSDMWAALLLAVVFGVLFMLTHIWGLLLYPVVWVVWRAFAWKLNGRGGMDSHTMTDTMYVFLRHGIMLFLVPVAYFNGVDVYLALGMVLVWMLIATALAYFNGQTSHRYNSSIEAVRGFAIGIVISKLVIETIRHT